MLNWIWSARLLIPCLQYNDFAASATYEFVLNENKVQLVGLDSVYSPHISLEYVQDKSVRCYLFVAFRYIRFGPRSTSN